MNHIFVNTFFAVMFLFFINFFEFTLLFAFIHLFLWYFTNVAKLSFFLCLSLSCFLMKFLISYNKYWCVWVNVCVCVLKLTCKSVWFLIPGNQQQTKFKHVLTQSTESLVYVRVWKTIVLQISHIKKTNVMYFLIICFLF